MLAIVGCERGGDQSGAGAHATLLVEPGTSDHRPANAVINSEVEFLRADPELQQLVIGAHAESLEGLPGIEFDASRVADTFVIKLSVSFQSQIDHGGGSVDEGVLVTLMDEWIAAYQQLQERRYNESLAPAMNSMKAIEERVLKHQQAMAEYLASLPHSPKVMATILEHKLREFSDAHGDIVSLRRSSANMQLPEAPGETSSASSAIAGAQTKVISDHLDSVIAEIKQLERQLARHDDLQRDLESARRQHESIMSHWLEINLRHQSDRLRVTILEPPTAATDHRDG